MMPCGGQCWTVPELLFEKKGLIPALQQLMLYPGSVIVP
jgi:hypothetical protein